jgi:acetyl esterase/lipase
MRKAAALAAVGGVGLVALVGRKHSEVRDALPTVAPELRSPVLPFTALPFTDRKLRFVRLLFSIPTRPGPGVSVTERAVGDPPVPTMIFTPERHDKPGPAVLWLHGGAYVVGTPRFEAAGAGRLVRELGAVVVSPDYRLAPEHPFPAGLDDCMAVLRWMRANADELGIDANRIAVTGSSAGGGMTAAVAQRSYDEGIPLRAQVMGYPMLDDRSTLRADHGGRGRFAWTPDSNRYGWTAYLGRPPRMSDAPEYAAPARRSNLSGLAPAWIGVGDLDVFYDEDVDYAERLKAAGVPCELVAVRGMYHGADGVAQKAPSMVRFRASMIDFLRKHLRG